MRNLRTFLNPSLKSDKLLEPRICEPHGGPGEMILADTSVWGQHFRRGLPDFAAALQNGQISIHPIIIGELAVGNLARRTQTLAALRALPRDIAGSSEECLNFIERHSLSGCGMGWNDVQLLVAACLSGHSLWSLDTRLAQAAEKLGVVYLVKL